MLTKTEVDTYGYNIQLKSRLLTEGCNISAGVDFPPNIQTKKIHLYAHSPFKSNFQIPEDIVLGKHPLALIVRVRYNPYSSLKIVKDNASYLLLDESINNTTEISFINSFVSEEDHDKSSSSISAVCSFLGKDLIGVAPSNHCFYYKDETECKFCEIWQTYKKEVEYEKPLKKVDAISAAVDFALQKNPQLEHIAITSGNVKSYDYTVEFFCKIATSIKAKASSNRIQHFLATLMPPDNLNLIKDLREAGFNKVYFPLEVFERSLFKETCPGKHKYGYDKILDALEYATNVFGSGNVYTNFIYGIQSLNTNLESTSYNPEVENHRALIAAEEMIRRGILPVFTVYHSAGYNQIGQIALSASHTFDFFEGLGKQLLESNLIDKQEKSVIFGPLSLSNTLYNETFLLAKLKRGNTL